MELSVIDLEPGRIGTVKRIEGGYGFQRNIASLGIRVGKSVKKLTSQPFRGPVVVEVDGTQIAIGRGMAAKIYVEVER